MAYFLCKLTPPRPTFAQDMTAAEAALMRSHAAYWTELSRRGIAILFGPVADPRGAWGVAIVEVDDEAGARALGAPDPVVKADIGFGFEVYPMPRVVLRA